MKRILRTGFLVFSLLSCISNDAFGLEEPFDDESIHFFESRVRPVLANHCLECHGSESQENDLRLDSRESILTGGVSGAAAIVGSPDESLLLLSVKHKSDYDMPPGQELKTQQIKDLAHWIKIGLPWPKSASNIATTTIADRILDHRQNHWAFQSIQIPELATPITDNESMVDRLLLESLEANGIGFSKIADRRTLIRRVYFDLVGIPPTYEEVTEFVDDSSPDAYENLVNRLLDSKHYGERWARHWLDVARYADTRGYTFNNADRNYPFAFTYRDYVINAFNKDLPYDQFIREQLAADYLDIPDDKRTLAALGFLTVGRKYIARPDTVDDQVDVVTRGLMGLTVSCARCHDHKFDAISTADYYSLFNVFENCHEPDELPLIGDPDLLVKHQEFFRKLESKQQDVADFETEFIRELENQIISNLVDYLARALEPDESKLSDLAELKLPASEVNSKVIEKWRAYLAKRANDNHPAIAPMGALFKLPNENFSNLAAKLIEHWNQDRPSKFNSIVLNALVDRPPKSKAEIGIVYGQLLTQLHEQWVAKGSSQPPRNSFSESEYELAKMIFDANSPAKVQKKEIRKYFNAARKKQWDKLQSEITNVHSQTPDGVCRAMTIQEDSPPRMGRVMIRGNANRRGEEVPRQFLPLLDPDCQPFKRRAGRLELANAIASKDNPLTARVLVNRVWMHHFSKPLVDTPSDFGIQCPAPLQRRLLDFLAKDFMQHDWSIKHLHRTIMLSNAYQQQSVDRDECVSIDPENHLFWKMNRRRLEFESLRDSILAVAGTLETDTFGKPVSLMKPPFSRRRTIYGKIDRQDLPNLFRVFDLASPDQSAEKRTRTTVPQQSLFMMNHEFIIQQAKYLANVVDQVDTETNTTGIRRRRVEKLYQAVFQRNPAPQEWVIADRFLDSATKKEDRLHPWQQLAQVLLWTNEFEFID